MNKKQINRFNHTNTDDKSVNSKQKKNNLKPLFFTFLGFFIVFFFAFTVLLPIITPQVGIPALTDQHSMSSVTSSDFKGRIDPRLKAIEEEENAAPPPKLKMEIPTNTESQTENPDVIYGQGSDDEAMTDKMQEPANSIPGEDNDYNFNIQKQIPDNALQQVKSKPKTTEQPLKSASVANIPPRPQSLQQNQPQVASTSSNNTGAVKSATIKVVLGSYSTPMQARLVSDTLIEMDLNVSPFIKERNGRYVLQVGSFSDPAKADGLVQELKNKGFNASAVSE